MHIPIDLAVIPVAGLGTRLLPLTKSQPKEMLPVGRKPVVQYIVEELARAGMRRLLFITGSAKASIENHFDANAELIQNLRQTGKEDLLAELAFERATVQYFYTRQRQLLGLGHAVLCAREFVGNQPFVVALGDSIIGSCPVPRAESASAPLRGAAQGERAQSDITPRLSRYFVETNASAVIALEEVPLDETRHYGIATPGGDGEVFPLADVIEKPSPASAPSRLAIAARYVFAPAIFDALARTRPGKGGEIQLTDAIRLLIQEGGKVYGVKLRDGERRYDIGNFESYFRAFVEFALADERYGRDLRAHAARLLEDLPADSGKDG